MNHLERVVGLFHFAYRVTSTVQLLEFSKLELSQSVLIELDTDSAKLRVSEPLRDINSTVGQYLLG